MTNEIEKVLREMFDENRTLTPLPLPVESNLIYGYLFKTQDNEIVYTDTIVDGNFDEETLINYVEIAENLYKDYLCTINLYLICAENVKVTVKECPIQSEADFNIKVQQSTNLVETALETIKEKIENNIKLTEMEIEALQMLPLYCDEKDRHTIRVECLKLLNKVDLNAK